MVDTVGKGGAGGRVRGAGVFLSRRAALGRPSSGTKAEKAFTTGAHVAIAVGVHDAVKKPAKKKKKIAKKPAKAFRASQGRLRD